MQPAKLQSGDEIRIIAPSQSMQLISNENRQLSNEKFESLGLKLSFGKNIESKDIFNSSSIDERLADLHAAFADKNVKGIFTVIGGFNSNQLLDYIDYDLIRANPKIFCGFSDITALQNAIYAKTNLITYSGPHYCTLGAKEGLEYTLEYLIKCLFQNESIELQPSEFWSDDTWHLNQSAREFIKNPGFHVINKGKASGTIIGGNLCTFTLLTGTPYMPDLENTILFIEDDDWPLQLTPQEFDRNLQSLIHLPNFSGVKGIIIGRFQKKSVMTLEKLEAIIKSKKVLNNLPILSNVDFGHTNPMITFPIGGTVDILATAEKLSIIISKH